MAIDEDAVIAFISSFPGLDTMEDRHARFFFYDPQRDTPHDKRQPFATVVNADDYETVSNLSRPGVYRVNMGVSRESYRSLLGPEPAWGKDGGVVQTGHDFTRLDAFLPHPFYAPMGWICILNPSSASWPRVEEYLREAHAIAKRQHERRRQT